MKSFKYSSTGKKDKLSLNESNLSKKISSKGKKHKLEEIEEEELKKEVKEELEA